MITSIIPTVSKLKIICLPFFYLLSLVLCAQEKEIIYIKYDEEREISDTVNLVGFTLKPSFTPSQNDYFIYSKDINEKHHISLSKIEKDLISKEIAIKKFLDYLKEVSKKMEDPEERRIYFNAMKSLPNFNGAFEKIYIYHVQDEMLYEVSWEYSISCL